MLNNLEFCCDTLRQNGAVDQDSLFCIFSGGRNCYYFCNCAAFKGSLAMASISQKKCFLIHPTCFILRASGSLFKLCRSQTVQGEGTTRRMCQQANKK